jgi:uncharacterized protein
MRLLLIAAGTLCVILGTIGIFLPVMPTTPFLLLAAACYARSSERFYHWLLNNRFLGTYIRNYREGLGMTLRAKVFTLTTLWAGIGYSAYIVDHLAIRLLLVVIASGVTIHLVSLPTYRPEQKALKGQDTASGAVEPSGTRTE